MPSLHQEELISSVGSLFGSSKYSDLTIRCGSDVYDVHRAIICQRSDFFAAACDSGFKESTTATITLDDDDQSTVRRMLTYLYTLDYDDGDALQTVPAASQDAGGVVADTTPEPGVVDDVKTSQCKRMNNIRVYALAEKYNIIALKELAKTKFESYQTSDDASHSREVISAIFDSTPDRDSGLRDIVILRAARASDVEKSLEDEALALLIRYHPSFALGMLREVVKKHNIELETQKQRVKTSTMKLKQTLGDVYTKTSRIDIPAGGASYETYGRSHQAFENYKREVYKAWNDVKLED